MSPRRLPAALLLAAALALPLAAQHADPALAQALLRQLVDTNTTAAAGTTAAARALAQRLLAAGFPPADVSLLGANPNKLNLVVRYRGTGAKPPILLIGHLDVVQARRQDWSTDPFQLVIKNGYFYGRGTQDMKDGDAIFLATLLQFKQENYQPDRDIILALTAAEEGGADNGVQWLLAHRRALIQAAFVLNADGGGVDAVHGQPQFLAVDASEKLYADFQLSTTNPGGHSSLPVPDNAIYHLTDGLARLQRFQFPFELNSVTRGFFRAYSRLDSGQRAADQRAILATPPDPAALRRLSADPLFNATLRTTCVPTRLSAGDANNALPQNAEAIVNCRIMPGHSALDIQRQLVSILADPKITVRYVDDAGGIRGQAPDAVSNPPVQLSPEVMRPLQALANQMWHGLPVVPDMATGASDGKYTNAAGMPTYALSGVSIDEDDVRAHGRDENLAVASFDTGAQFYYRFLKLLTGGR
ncbi:MAG TPA: M20/M25/M40 family metallo-hydrolase [Terriglobales bacterium]|nr:M20/M25/M40 family metallo-hydrolase [Terriglobales bacterium]